MRTVRIGNATFRVYQNACQAAGRPAFEAAVRASLFIKKN
jgi:hypothetical protein